MLKKIALSKRGILLYFILVSLVIVQSCQKNVLQPQFNSSQNSLSIAEAKKYFDTHVPQDKSQQNVESTASQNFTVENMLKNKKAVWDKAYEKTISTGKAVQIPVDFGNVYAVVDQKKRAVVPFNSLNYLLMYKDSLAAIHLEWVILNPDSAWLYGNRNNYTGDIIVRNWEGRILNKYSYDSHGFKNTTANIKSGKSGSVSHTQVTSGGVIETPVSGPGGPFCFTYQVPAQCTCSDKSRCDLCPICTKTVCFWPEPACLTCGGIDPGTPGGGGNNAGGGGGGSGGGGSGGGNYPPSCNPDPNYVMPATPAPSGKSWILPCGGAVPTPEPLPLEPVSPINPGMSLSVRMLIDRLGITDPNKIDFIRNNESAAGSIINYLNVKGNSLENKTYVSWAIDYLTANPDENVSDFVVNFMTPNEGSESGVIDDGFYENTVQQQQQLPGKMDYFNHYPKLVDEKGRILGLSSSAVYSMIGGQIGSKYQQKGYTNACALRGSLALNYSGITIPDLVYENKKKTEKGADGKNYILAADAFQKFTKETFGSATYTLTAQEMDRDPGNIARFLKGKTGIYVVINKYPGKALYTGHVDFIIDGRCINGANLNPEGGLYSIEIWQLN